VIVNIAGWLYIIYAVLGLGSLSLGAFSFGMTKSNLVTLLVSALYGAIGYGLLKRDPRARWAALGSSLLAWIIGGLVIVIGIAGLIYLGIQDGKSGPGQMVGAIFSGIGSLIFLFMATVFVAIFVAVTVVHYKLFWYLCSREGCAEFGAPYGSSVTVLASVGAWIAVGLAEVWMMSSGVSSLLLQQAFSRDDSGSREYEREAARQRTRQALESEAARKHEAVLEEARLAMEQAQAGEAREAAVSPEGAARLGEAAHESAETAPPDSEAPVPVFGELPEASDETESKPNKILKCRDKAGSVSYTQGYCPPGTTLVDTPRYE
jgi:hypothetical protein